MPRVNVVAIAILLGLAAGRRARLAVARATSVPAIVAVLGSASC